MGPVCKETWLSTLDSMEPEPRFATPVLEAFVFPPCPVQNPRIQESAHSLLQFRAEELTVVVPPTPNVRVETLGQPAERPSTLLRAHHLPESVSNPLGLHRTDRRIETGEPESSAINRHTPSELETQVLESCIRIRPLPSIIFTIDNLRFGGVKGESTGLETLSKAPPEHLGLLFRFAVTNHIVCVPFKPHIGPMSLHPNIKRIMQKEIGQ